MRSHLFLCFLQHPPRYGRLHETICGDIQYDNKKSVRFSCLLAFGCFHWTSHTHAMPRKTVPKALPQVCKGNFVLQRKLNDNGKLVGVVCHSNPTVFCQQHFIGCSIASPTFVATCPLFFFESTQGLTRKLFPLVAPVSKNFRRTSQTTEILTNEWHLWAETGFTIEEFNKLYQICWTVLAKPIQGMRTKKKKLTRHEILLLICMFIC